MGQTYHGKFIGSIALAVLGVACQMVPYFCVAHIVTALMLSGDQEFSHYVTASVIALCGYLGKVIFLSFHNNFSQRPITRCAIYGRISPLNWPASRWGRFADLRPVV